MRVSVFLGMLLAWMLPGMASAAANGKPVTIGELFEIRSESMGETRTYQVHRPASYDAGNDRYPVLIVLDGEEDFAHASTTVDALSAADRIPPMIVIGIPNTDRARDLIPHRTLPPGSAPPNHGGPEKLIQFLATELLPKIDRDYRTRPYRVLVGHSNGGLLALYALIREPDAFKGYVIASPALPDSPALSKEVDAFLQEHKDLAPDIYMTMANETGRMLGATLELAGWLEARSVRTQLRSTFRRYPEETHGSVPLRSIYDGLQALFDGWTMADPFRFYEESGLTGLDKHFATMSARLGYTVNPPQQMLIRIYAGLDGRNRLPEAEQVLNKAIEWYPTSAELYMYSGRLALEMKNKPLAIERLRKSLALDPKFAYVRELLTQAGADPN